MKKILITGGSGTVGSSFIEKYYKDYSFFSFSRNEKMQVSLKRRFEEIEIILGSVTDKHILMNAMSKVNPDIVIHAAALKHVDTAEISPIEAIKSNIIGSLNVIESSVSNNVPITLGISTDKACTPDNNYGYTKSLMEKMFLQAHSERNKFTVCRFGNVTHSHGSVLPFWIREKINNRPLKLTDKKMNRLMFSRNEAVQLVHKALDQTSAEKETFILSQKMKTVNMFELANILSDQIEIIGKRPGEKLDEILISENELPYTFVEDKFVSIRQYKNNSDNTLDKEYSSLTAKKMSKEEIIDIISETDKDLKESLIESALY